MPPRPNLHAKSLKLREESGTLKATPTIERRKVQKKNKVRRRSGQLERPWPRWNRVKKR